MALVVVVEGATVEDSVSTVTDTEDAEVDPAGGVPVELDSEEDGTPGVSEVGGTTEALGPLDDAVGEAGGGAGVVSVEGADEPDCGGALEPLPAGGGADDSVEAGGTGATEDEVSGPPVAGGALVAGGRLLARGPEVAGTTEVAVQVEAVTVTVTVTGSGSTQQSVKVKLLRL